jgi:hypothetical protein
MFAIVFFPVSGYLGAMAMGTLEFYGCFHDFIVIPCVPFVITPLSYFVDHLQMAFNPQTDTNPCRLMAQSVEL